nr:MAG TPA: hypothetical protein [Caudoviricetes sp.]
MSQILINSRGNTIQDRLSFDIELAKNARNKEHKKALAFQALGAVEIAVDFGLITYIEFERYISKIFEML